MSYQLFNAGRFVSRGRGSHPARTIESDELIYVLRGELAMFEDDRHFWLRPGDWLLLRHGRRHGGLAPYPKNLSFFWLHFLDDGEIISALPQSGRVAERSRLADYAQLFLTEQSRSEPDRTALDLLFQLIRRELLRAPESGTAGLAATPLAEAAEQYIALHYSEPLSPRVLGRELKCHPRYLARLYRKVFGETINAAVIRRRLARAAELLTTEPRSVKESAAACGFNDPAYFRRCFNRRYGMTPGAFRRERTRGHRNTDD